MLPHCIFSHDEPQAQDIQTPASELAEHGIEPVAKRLKLSDGTGPSDISTTDQNASRTVFTGSIMPISKQVATNKINRHQGVPHEPLVHDSSAKICPVPDTAQKVITSSANHSKSAAAQQAPLATSSDTRPAREPQLLNVTTDAKTVKILPKSATRPVSPPTTAAAAGPKSEPSLATSTPKAEVPVALMPRKLAKDPAPFTKRLTFLKALHGYLKPQNEKIAKAIKPEIRALYLSANQLNKLAVDEEARIAQENPSVYENILKQRLVKLKGMTPEIWVKERREALAKERGDPPKKPPQKRVDTGLSAAEEISFLAVLTCPQDGLDKHGYVTQLPTEKDLKDTQLTLESAACWEVCDRCATRFQVFPERREEDGALTSGGQCRHHWGRRIFPKKTKDAAPEPTRIGCCNEPVGSPGCVTHDSHVFKISDPKRLSLVMPFIETPENEQAPDHTAVCFDCEMGYTTFGLELMRLTVVAWPAHKPIIDVLVRPLGHILDVNTRFSGITAEQFVNAKPYDPENPKPVRKDLRIVESPYAARDLFLSHVTRSTPVLGHALENDLNTIRLIHPTIIDTVLLYPTRQGLPFRHGLRNLAKMYLEENIQQGGAAGHDSFEDARTTGELVRFKIKEKWKTLKIEGWTIGDDGVFPPMPVGPPPGASALPVPSMIPPMPTSSMEAEKAEKRKLDSVD